MAVTIITQVDRPSKNDKLAQQQAEHRRRVDTRDSYVDEKVTVHFGAGGKDATHDITLTRPINGPYVFITAAKNQAIANHNSYEVWQAVAHDAINKFCGLRSASIKFGPRPEDHNRYNFMAELQAPIGDE